MLCLKSIVFTVVLGNIFVTFSRAFIQAPEIHSWEIWTHKASCSSLKIHLRESKPKKNLEAEAVHLLYIHVSWDSSKNLIHIRHGQWSCVCSITQHGAYKKVRLLEHVRSLNLVGQRGTTCNASSEKFSSFIFQEFEDGTTEVNSNRAKSSSRNHHCLISHNKSLDWFR